MKTEEAKVLSVGDMRSIGFTVDCNGKCGLHGVGDGVEVHFRRFQIHFSLGEEAQQNIENALAAQDPDTNVNLLDFVEVESLWITPCMLGELIEKIRKVR